MELPGVEDHIVADLKKNKPSWIVTTTENQGLSAYKPGKITAFIDSNYTEAFHKDIYRFLIKTQ
jgi:hypothetical protein